MKETRRWTLSYCADPEGYVHIGPCSVDGPILELGERGIEVIEASAYEKALAERDAYLERLGAVNVERQRQEVRAIEAERELEALREAAQALLADVPPLYRQLPRGRSLRDLLAPPTSEEG